MKKPAIADICAILLLLNCIAGFAQSKKVIHVIYIGDSITQGVQLDNPASQAPPATANAYLRSYYKSGTIDFSNHGISGFTTVDFLPPGEIFKQVEQAANEIKDKPGILVFSIMLGTNDSAIVGPNGSPVQPLDYFKNLKAITDQLLNDYPGCRVIIHHPIWYSPNTYNGSRYLQEGLDRLQSYFPQIKNLVRDYAKSNKNRVFLGDTIGFGYFRNNYLTDLRPEQGREGIFYLHPNVRGATALGEFWGKAIIKDIIKKQ